VNGWRPGDPPYVAKVRTLTPAKAREVAESPQTFGSAPTDPLNGPYGPFQRWTMEGNYLPTYRGIHGKLFFTMGGTDRVCSATVIGRSTIATAGHCVNSGPPDKAFGGNFLFCPSYYNGGAGGAGIPHPSRGCWSWSGAGTTSPWIQAGDPDYDYGCIVLATTGTVVSDKVGNVTGWAGRAWNFVDVPEMIFGYPADSPFTGQVIQQVATVDWYNWDPVAGGQVSKVVGNDLTGGSSGGGWFLAWRAPGAEFPDTDGSDATDPGTAGPFLNGVNSHKRCLVDCSSPPTSTEGVFWQEMTSPPFRGGSPTDADESEDIFTSGACLGHPNNDP
jgi:V8-like Glu-specific endopeptidase